MKTSEAILSALRLAARESDDSQTRTAAILLTPFRKEPVAWSANVLPDGIAKSGDRTVRPGKYAFVEHAERAVIYKAARQGMQVAGTIMACSHFPCADCARAIVMSGIPGICVAGTFDDVSTAWADSQKTARDILSEAGVSIDPLSALDQPIDIASIRHRSGNAGITKAKYRLSVSERIYQARKAAGMTVDEVAAKAGLSKRDILDLEECDLPDERFDIVAQRAMKVVG